MRTVRGRGKARARRLALRALVANQISRGLSACKHPQQAGCGVRAGVGDSKTAGMPCKGKIWKRRNIYTQDMSEALGRERR